MGRRDASATWATSGTLAGFSQAKNCVSTSVRVRGWKETGKNGSLLRKMRGADARSALITLHRPVDGLHSIEFSGDTRLHFSLTIKIKGVQTTSFFDSF
jgi:hypothetical protein